MARPNPICNTTREIGLAMHRALALKILQKTAPPAVPLASQNEWGQESGARRGKRMGNSVGPGHNVGCCRAGRNGAPAGSGGRSMQCSMQYWATAG